MDNNLYGQVLLMAISEVKNYSTKYGRVEADLLAMIENGQIATGQKIPGEYDLCEKYSISRFTARRAIDNLSQKGYLTKSQGRGTFVNDFHSEIAQKKNITKLLMRNIAMFVIGSIREDGEGWNSKLLRIASMEAEKRGYHMSLCGISREQMAEGKLPLPIREKTVCGILVDGWTNDSVMQCLADTNIPFVLVGNHENRLGVPEISHDVEDAAYQITTSLLRLDRGPVWLIGPNTREYHTGRVISSGYQRAIFDHNDSARLSHLNCCEPAGCKSIIEHIANIQQRKHCLIVLDDEHYNVLLNSIKRAGLNKADFTFASIGRRHKGWGDKDGIIFCETDPTMTARESVRQLVELSKNSTPLKSKRFKLKVEKINNDRKPYSFSWT